VLAGVGVLHAAFLNESRTPSPWWRPVQEIREPGPKMVFFQCFLFMYQGSRSGQLPFARRVGTIEGLRPIFFGPCTLRRTWGTRPGKWALLLAPRVHLGTKPSSDFWRALERNCFVCQTNRDIERARIAPVDAIVGANNSSDDDSTVETRTVQQRLEHFFGD
jgi:hypothetical protein